MTLLAELKRRNVIRNSGVLAYWQSNGFPPRCRALGREDLACD